MTAGEDDAFDEFDVPYDPDAQVLAGVLRVLEAVPRHADVFWACEYVCPQDADGTSFFASKTAAGLPDRVTLTLGRGDVSAELDVPVPALAADGIALWQGAWVRSGSHGFHDTRADLLWVGLRTAPAWVGWVDDTADQYATPAFSFPALGAQLAALIAVYRPDVTLILDEDWECHRHPLGGILGLAWPPDGVHADPAGAPVAEGAGTGPAAEGAEWGAFEVVSSGGVADEDYYTLRVGDDGEATVRASGQVMDVLLELEIAHQRFLDSLSPQERERYAYEEQWMEWTDGTFDPDGWVSS